MSAPLSDRVLEARDRITATIAHPTTSDWLRRALIDALERDPLDARADAFLLHMLLRELVNATHEAMELDYELQEAAALDAALEVTP
jgi:hypothetical protein